MTDAKNYISQKLEKRESYYTQQWSEYKVTSWFGKILSIIGFLIIVFGIWLACLETNFRSPTGNSVILIILAGITIEGVAAAMVTVQCKSQLKLVEEAFRMNMALLMIDETFTDNEEKKAARKELIQVLKEKITKG